MSQLTLQRDPAATQRPRVLIVGGGFGGLNAAKSLAHASSEKICSSQQSSASAASGLRSISRPSIRTWIKAGLLHKKRNGRIAEDSLQSFLYSHPERINWPLLDKDTTFWVSDLLEAEKIRVNEAGTRTRANSRSSEGTQAAEASTSDGSSSSTPEADPCEDPASHNSRARDASPQQ